MPITGPLDVVTVDQMKTEMIIDFSGEEDIIAEKIRAAISLIEQRTLWRFYPRTETMQTSQSYSDIYQWPLTSVSAVNSSAEPSVFKSKYYPLRQQINFEYCNSPYWVITLKTGASELSEIPDTLIEAIKRQVVFLYENRDNSKAIIPDDVQEMISQFRRFTYF